MDKKKFLLETIPNSKVLEAVDSTNRAIDTSQGISKSRLFLIALSTNIMTALTKPLPKEYYQWTRAYLETIKNEDGTSLENIPKFLRHMDWFEKSHNIEDELQNSKIVLPSEEMIEFHIQEPDEDAVSIQDTSMLSSTKLPSTVLDPLAIGASQSPRISGATQPASIMAQMTSSTGSVNLPSTGTGNVQFPQITGSAQNVSSSAPVQGAPSTGSVQFAQNTGSIQSVGLVLGSSTGKVSKKTKKSSEAASRSGLVQQVTSNPSPPQSP